MHGNANTMTCFPDARFDTILCNSVLEHDPFFWRTLAEMRRVARRGALIVVGVPGYGTAPSQALRRLVRPLAGAPGGIGRWIAGWLASTPTLRPHLHPGDFYRFSPQAVSEVFLAGLSDIQIATVVRPPRVIGAGRLPYEQEHPPLRDSGKLGTGGGRDGTARWLARRVQQYDGSIPPAHPPRGGAICCAGFREE